MKNKKILNISLIALFVGLIVFLLMFRQPLLHSYFSYQLNKDPKLSYEYISLPKTDIRFEALKLWVNDRGRRFVIDGILAAAVELRKLSNENDCIAITVNFDHPFNSFDMEVESFREGRFYSCWRSRAISLKNCEDLELGFLIGSENSHQSFDYVVRQISKKSSYEISMNQSRLTNLLIEKFRSHKSDFRKYFLNTLIYSMSEEKADHLFVIKRNIDVGPMIKVVKEEFESEVSNTLKEEYEKILKVYEEYQNEPSRLVD